MDRIAISVAEFCRITSIGRTKTYQLMNSGKLRTVKLGSRRLISTDSLTDLFDSAFAEKGGSDAQV